MAGALTPRTQASLDEGVRLIESGHWFEAHEALEDAWLVEEGLARLALQGFIQLAAAFHKGLKMNNPAGMVRLLDASLEKLRRVAALEPAFGGIDVAALARDLALTRASAVSRCEPGGAASEVRMPELKRLTSQ